MRARRQQDLADVVALLKPLDDAHYIEVEAALPTPLRAELARLRHEAIEERAPERRGGE